MSGTVKRRESRERFSKSEPSLSEDPEDLEDEQKKEDSKRPVAGGADDTPALPRHPESSILSTEIDA
jgi:hypothetical protein